MSEKTKAFLFLLGVYLSMIIGMLAKTYFDHLTQGKAIEAKDFLIPLIVSPMVYGAVFKIVQNSSETTLMLIFGFQNGFFWQDIFGRLIETGGAS